MAGGTIMIKRMNECYNIFAFTCFSWLTWIIWWMQQLFFYSSAYWWKHGIFTSLISVGSQVYEIISSTKNLVYILGLKFLQFVLLVSHVKVKRDSPFCTCLDSKGNLSEGKY